MCSATSAAIQVMNGNDSNDTFPLGWLAKPEILRGILEPYRHRTVLENNFVGPALGFADLRGFKRAGYVDGARIDTQMKAHRVGIEQLDEHGGQKMLSGVLLHMIKAPLPIDHAGDFVSLDRRSYLMRDPAVFIHYFRYVGSAQLPEVEGLAARRRIEGRAIEINPAPIGARAHDPGPKFSQVAVVVIKAIRH